MANNEQNDKELNDYFNGDSDISKAYRASNKTEPSSQLDDAILLAAKEAVNVSNNNSKQKEKLKFHKSPWVKPVSIAAMITLSVSLVVTMQQESGKPLISGPEVEMFDSASIVEELEVSGTITSSDGVPVKGDINIKENKDERVEVPAPTPEALGAAADIYRAEKKTEAPKARMKKAPAKKMLLKEKAQTQTEIVEERTFVDEVLMQSAPAAVEFIELMDAEQDREFSIQEDALLKIKALWVQGELISAKQAYEDFVKNYPDMSSESIKGILGENIYNGLIDD